MAPYCRAQVLLEPEQRERLREIAHREERSVSDVVRTILDAGLKALAEENADQRRADRLAALDRLAAMRRSKPYAYHGDLLAEVRAERDADFERIWNGE